MKSTELEKTIRAFLRDELGVRDADLTDDDQLVSSGLIDSAGVVRLAALLENELGIVIPDRDINPRNFDTLAKIEAYIEARRAR